MSLLELFCAVHDFCGVFQPRWQTELLTHRVHRRRRERPLDRREIMLILIHFHQSHYRDFKAFYTHSVLGPLRAEFPGLVSYTRFVEFIPSVLIPLGAYRRYGRGTCTGISFVDSTDLTVGPTRRIAQHKVLKGLAEGGQTSTGWFFGFKVHFGFHDRGEWWDGTLTAGKVDDRTPVPHLVKRWFGKRVGAKGYMARKLQDELRETWRVQLITKLKRNMKNQLMP